MSAQVFDGVLGRHLTASVNGKRAYHVVKGQVSPELIEQICSPPSHYGYIPNGISLFYCTAQSLKSII